MGPPPEDVVMQVAPSIHEMPDEELFPEAIRIRSKIPETRSEAEQAALREMISELRTRGYRLAQVGRGAQRRYIIAPIRR